MPALLGVRPIPGLHANPALRIKAAATARAHAVMMRRNLLSIRQAGRPSVRSREVVWVVIEAYDAAFEGRRLTHKHLAATALGVIGAATVTRAVDRAVQRGLLRRVRDPRDARLIPARSDGDLFEVGIAGEGAEAVWRELVPGEAESVEDAVVVWEEPVGEVTFSQV